MIRVFAFAVVATLALSLAERAANASVTDTSASAVPANDVVDNKKKKRSSSCNWR